MTGLAEGIVVGATIRHRSYPFDTRDALGDFLEEAAALPAYLSPLEREQVVDMAKELTAYARLYDELEGRELDCEDCSGSGKVTRFEDGGRTPIETECSACGGFGRREDY
jgi:hypothetical protein